MGDGSRSKPLNELEPHRYVPSAKHMGDCQVCGHIQGAEIHSPVAGLPVDTAALRRIGETFGHPEHKAFVVSAADEIDRLRERVASIPARKARPEKKKQR